MKADFNKNASDFFFDLEQEILRVWGIKEDLEILLHKYIDSPRPMTEDEVSNYLSALVHILDLRCQKSFDTFEKYANAKYQEKDYKVNHEANELLETAATIVEFEGLEHASSVPPEPLRARLARQIRKLKSSPFKDQDEDKEMDF